MAGTIQGTPKRRTVTTKRARRAATAEPRLPAHDEIALRARALYEASGCASGRDVEFWLEAERQLREELNA